MEKDFTPILVVPAVPHNGGIRFLHRESQLDIDPEMATDVWRILKYCNGYNDVQTISKLLALSIDDVIDLLSQLVELELIVDSREQYLHFHRIRSYPTPFNYNLSQDEIVSYTRSPRESTKNGDILKFKRMENTFFSNILKKRRSCRNFSEEKLSINQIGNICHFSYSIKDHAVPSGGALYPLRLYILIEKDQDGIKTGYYEYDAEKDYLILFNTEVDEEQLKYCFNQECMPFGSSVQIIIAANLKRQPFKYANRGYMLTLIEAGHVAENISLFCAEQGLGSCELGGIQDEPLRAELELDSDIYPLIAISIGYRSNTENITIDKIRYVEENVSNDKPVEKFWTRCFGNDGSFFGATSVYKDSNNQFQYAGATSSSYADAVFKATIEGYERWLSGQVRSDYYGAASKLTNWAHPYDYFPLTKEQAEKCNVAYFTKDLPINWTIGYQFDGTEIYVPSDIVYYGQKSKDNRIYFSHSSGVAAYSNFKEAEKRALTELLERDALMRNWYSHKPPKTIEEKILPIHARKRIKHWQNLNRRMLILEIPSDYCWVFETIIISEKYPCFVSGAAAAVEKNLIPVAIHKSLQEAEYNLLLCINYPNNSEIDPKSVSSPIEHGKVYHMKKYAKTLSWLWNGCITSNFATVKMRSIEELKSELKTITVDLSDSKLGLSVVRVLSPKLVQINFGFNSAHYLYPHLDLCQESLSMPHYFA